MKIGKRLATLALCLVMALGMVGTAGAAILDPDDPNAGKAYEVNGTLWGTITFENTPTDNYVGGETNHDYTAYRLFDLKSPPAKKPQGESGYSETWTQETLKQWYDENGYQYEVLESSPWFDFFNKGAGAEYVTLAEPYDKTHWVFENETSTTITQKTEKAYIVQPTDKLTTEEGAQALAQAALTALNGGIVIVPEWRIRPAAGEDYLEKFVAYKFGIKRLTDDSGTRTMSTDKIPAGYYFVNSTVGSLCSVGSAQVDVTLEEKNVEPTINIQVWEDDYDGSRSSIDQNWWTEDTIGWGKNNSAAIGEDTYVRAVFTIGNGVKDYKLNLYVPSGLAVDENGFVFYKQERTNGIVTAVSQVEATNNYTQSGPVTVYTKGSGSSGVFESETGSDNSDKEQKYTFDINNDFIAGLKPGDRVFVTYHTVLSKEANVYVMGLAGRRLWETRGYNSHLAQLDWESIDQASDEDINRKPLRTRAAGATTWSYSVDLAKTDGEGKHLTGAKFVLQDSAGEQIPLVKVKNFEANYLSEGQNANVGYPAGMLYRVATVEERGATEFESAVIEAGYAIIIGLDYGTYQFEELEAPKGYNKAGVQVFSFEQIASRPHMNLDGVIDEEPSSSSSGSGGGVGGGGSDIREPDMEAEVFSSRKLQSSSGDKLSGGLIIGGRGYAREKIGIPQISVNGGSKTEICAFYTRAEDGTYTYGAIERNLANAEGTEWIETEVKGGVAVVNLTGAELPHTGGIGTTIFYVVGGLLVVGAGVLLVVKKRMKTEE